MKRPALLDILEPLSDRAIVALTLGGEARGEPIEGQIAVAIAIRNRVLADIGRDNKPDWWGEGYRDVCLKASQFSCWNDGDATQEWCIAQAGILRAGESNPTLRQLLWVADGVMSGAVTDNLRGAVQYHTVDSSPWWAPAMIMVAKKGRHVFYRDPKIAI